jgi:hypothetical protein
MVTVLTQIGIVPENVDIRIISDPYKYTLFKKLHNLNDWPSFDSDEHNSMITKLMNTEARKINYTYEDIDKLIADYFKCGEMIRIATDEEAEKILQTTRIFDLHKYFSDTNKEMAIFKNKFKSHEEEDED